MSIVTLNKKTMAQYSKNKSASQPGGGNYWMSQGPFGNTGKNIITYSNVGFSMNGSYRNIGYIGKTYQVSKNAPYKGNYVLGDGSGLNGEETTSTQLYNPEQIFNSSRFVVMGTDNKYIKPSTLSTKGMLAKKYKWIHSGQYPNYWVDTNNVNTVLSNTKSQGNYIDNLAVSNLCVSDVNNVDTYEGYVKNGGSTLCKTTTAGFTYNDMARNGLYTKFINQSNDCSVYTREVKQNCIDIFEAQKPLPFGIIDNPNLFLYYPPEPL